MNSNKDTSLITILSSEHGRLRREQRDIQKRDLQKALRHGTYERSWGRRWKVTYDGITFITDNDRRKEVTCYPTPLSKAPVDDKASNEHGKAKKIISRKKDICTSHTVLVVDNSGSMRTHDIPLHRDRQVAAFTTMALEYVAEQLFNKSANNRDVVSLVEFGKTAKIIFSREPFSWVLFNKLLDRRDKSNHVSRISRRFSDAYSGDSNYLPALEIAEELLALENHEDCALSMFFLSDGEPTDTTTNDLLPSAALRLMTDRVAAIANRFDYQLNMSFVGFGGSTKDFKWLKSMADAANESVGMPIASFVYCHKLANSIGAAITSLAESTTLTRTALMNGERRTKRNTRTDIEPEESSSNEWDRYKITSHFVFDPSKNNWMYCSGLPMGALRNENLVEADQMLRENRLPPYIKMKQGYIGTGVERVAYRCQLSDENGQQKLGSMIAKETVRADRIDEHVAFHKSFCATQSLAAHLASEFNKRLLALPDCSTSATPKVSFLKCSVLILDDPQWPKGKRGILVEKQLDTDRFEWRKWNNNAGAVDGKIIHSPMDVDYELAQLEQMPLRNNCLAEMIIEEGSEGSESSDTISSGSEAIGKEGNACCDERNRGCGDNMVDSSSDFKPSDYLQAFSHFTYLFTNRKLLVCDLQGVYNTDLVPPTFELSDPAIHYRSTRGRDMVFGRTDRGQKGIQQFFNSHKCTGICKFLELSNKNKKWKKEWRRDFAKDMENNLSIK